MAIAMPAGGGVLTIEVATGALGHLATPLEIPAPKQSLLEALGSRHHRRSGARTAVRERAIGGRRHALAAERAGLGRRLARRGGQLLLAHAGSLHGGRRAGRRGASRITSRWRCRTSGSRRKRAAATNCARGRRTSSCSTSCSRRCTEHRRADRDVRSHLRDRHAQCCRTTRSLLPLALPDGVHAKLLRARRRRGRAFPDVVEIPGRSSASPNWEYDLIDDLQADPVQRDLRGDAARLPLGAARADSARRSVRRRARVPVVRARRLQRRRRPRRSPHRRPRRARAGARAAAREASQRADEADARAPRCSRRACATLTEELDARTGYRRVVGESADVEAGADAGDAGRGHRHDRAAARRIGHRQGSGRALHPSRVGAAATARSSRSTARRCPSSCSRRSCSATSAAPSPARRRASRGSSSRRPAARCSSTRSAR